MKKFSLLLLFLTLVFSSCKKDATEVNFTTNISATSDDIVVNETSMKTNSNHYDVEFEVNLENEDTQEYLDKIKDIDIQELNLIFNGLEDLAGNQTPTNLKITIDNNIVFEYNGFKYDLVASGEKFQIENTDKIKEVAELLQNKKKVTVRIEGVIPDMNFHQFTITVDALAKITADVL